jgi:hypothetical protein
MAEPNPYDVSQMTSQYAQNLAPEYARSRASIANMLGGRGTMYGTPGVNKLSLLENQRMSDVGKYTQGLMQTQEQRAYDQPFKIGEMLGNMPGSSGTYQPGQGWSWTGGPTQTLGGRTTGAAEMKAGADVMTGQAERIKGLAQMLAPAYGGDASKALIVAPLILKLMNDNPNLFAGFTGA